MNITEKIEKVLEETKAPVFKKKTVLTSAIKKELIEWLEGKKIEIEHKEYPTRKEMTDIGLQHGHNEALQYLIDELRED